MPKKMRICSIGLDDWRYLEPPASKKDLLELALQRIDIAASNKPNIISLPEVFSFYFLPHKQWQHKAIYSESIANALKEKAKKYNTFILCPVITLSDQAMYNTVILIDNQGGILGQYDKVFPTIEEINAGVKPGKNPKVMDISIGKIGITICFDINFPELAAQYYRQNVEVIFFCSMFDGGDLLRCWALNHDFWVVSSVFNGSNKVIDPLGAVRVESSLHQPILFFDINLDSKIFHVDNNKSRIEQMQIKYGNGVKVSYNSQQAKVLVELNCEKNIDELQEEFNLEPLRDYLLRSKNLRNSAL
jgi:predicted amidohydrolase